MSLLSYQGAARLVVLAMTAACVAGCKPDTPIPHSSPRGELPAATPAPLNPSSTGATAANITADDEALATKVEAALSAETTLHGSSIDVVADDGVVTLTGSTRSPDTRSIAAQIALSIDGVKHVRNELAVSRDT